MPTELDAEVLRCQVDSLRAALVKVLDTRETEAKAWFSYENAKANFSGRGAVEGRRHLAAMTAASNAEKEARLLLATLTAPKTSATELKPDEPRPAYDLNLVPRRG